MAELDRLPISAATCCEPAARPMLRPRRRRRLRMLDHAAPARETFASGAREVRRLRGRGFRHCRESRRPRATFGSALYGEDERGAAVEASLGCGVPTAVADLHEGETVLDLGSGAGADVLISARRVGPTGTAIGLDMTDEMLELARRNAAEAGVTNAEFVKGYLEELPLPDASVDVVISNCVINLSADKPRVLARGRAGAASPAAASRSPT